MTEKSWMEVDTSDSMGMAKADGTMHICPSKIHSSAVAIIDPILIPEFIEQLCHILAVVVDIEEDLHTMFSDFVGLDTTEHQDHEAMRWCYEDE